MATYYRAKCDNGCEIVGQKSNIARRSLTSCQCNKSPKASRGSWGHPLYKTWRHMLDRCENPHSKSYKDYGGRGVSVCRRWRDGDGNNSGFDCFASDMGERPSATHTLGRIRNELGYGPDNCRWETRTQQNNNRRQNINVCIDGLTMTVAEWCRQTGVPLFTAYRRIGLGWDLAEAVTKPPRKKASCD